MGVGQFGIATLYMDNTWQPPADSVTLAINSGPDHYPVCQYRLEGRQLGRGRPAGAGNLAFSFADYTNKYPTGRVPIADLNFQGVAHGTDDHKHPGQ